MRSQNTISTKEGTPADDAEREQCAQIRELLDNPSSFAVKAGYEMGAAAGTRDATRAVINLGMRAGLIVAAEELERLAARLRSHAEAPRDDTDQEAS